MKRMGFLLVAGLVASLALSGCGRVSSTNFVGVKNLFAGNKPPAPKPQYLALVKAGAPGMITLVEETGRFDVARKITTRDGVTSWMTQGGRVLSLRNGMLISSRGMGGDMMSGDARQVHALLRARQSGQAQQFSSWLDGNHHVVQTAFVCDVKNTGRAPVALAEGKEMATLMSADCQGPDYGFYNLYWVDDRGEIVQSRQYLGPLIGMVDFLPLTSAGLARMMGAGS